MSPSRSPHTLIAEHKRFREQCRKAIAPSLKLSAILTVAALLGVLLLHASWWLLSGVVAFASLSTGMEVLGYLRHGRALRRLTASNSAMETPP